MNMTLEDVKHSRDKIGVVYINGREITILAKVSQTFL